MGRKANSQWDFGDLFEEAETRRVLRVSELTAAVKRLLEREYPTLWVSGEVSNLRRQSSGHCYFTLKDEGAQLSCVLFRGTNTPYRDLLEDGRSLLVQGQLTVYEPRGQYQMVVRQVELQGVGALQAAFERLKRKLQVEGLFAPERKRPLPERVYRLGVITSPTGAALRDVVHVVRRRNAALQVVLAPCRVQGEGAGQEIADALGLLNSWVRGDVERRPLDAILLTRGGGSLEDLWAFNEEAVARAIVASAVPVVSAVGHEIDFTISDFVADLRAATPSAGAELLTEGVLQSGRWVRETAAAFSGLVRERIAVEREELVRFEERVGRAHPRRRLNELGQRLDDLRFTLRRTMRAGGRLRMTAWEALRRRWLALHPTAALERRREQLSEVERGLIRVARDGVEQARQRWWRAVTRLQLLSPQSVLERGFSITMDAETGTILREPADVREGQRLRTRLRQGEVESRVERFGMDRDDHPR